MRNRIRVVASNRLVIGDVDVERAGSGVAVVVGDDDGEIVEIIDAVGRVIGRSVAVTNLSGTEIDAGDGQGTARVTIVSPTLSISTPLMVTLSMSSSPLIEMTPVVVSMV